MASIQTAMRSRGAIDVRRCAFSSHWTASPPKRKEEASYGKDCTDIINESARHRGYSSLSTSLPPIHGLCFRAPISQNRHACSRRVLYYSTTSSGPRRTHWPHTAMLLQQKQCNNSTLYGYSSNHRRSFASGKKRDLYDVLGVAKSADKGTLKKAYFQLAKKHHPDTNQVRIQFVPIFILWPCWIAVCASYRIQLIAALTTMLTFVSNLFRV